MNRASKISAAVFVAAFFLGVFTERWKLLGIISIATAATLGFGVLASRTASGAPPRTIVASFGVASGAMIASAAVFLLPKAFGASALHGGVGVGVGVLTGYTLHTFGHQLTHRFDTIDSKVLEVSLHSVAGGAFMGIMYSALPSLSALAGLSILSHKAPAGYVLAVRPEYHDSPLNAVVLPATLVGITAFPAAAVTSFAPMPSPGLVFGVAAGVFVHVALDFLPECDVGSELYHAVEHACQNTASDAHDVLDRQRHIAVLSTVTGFAVIIALRLLIS